MADLQKIVNDLSGLTALEAAELVKLLEEKSPQYSLAINNQTELKSDLDKLLEYGRQWITEA